MSHEEPLHCSHLSKTEHLAVAYDQKLEHPLQHTRAAHQGKNWSMARRLGAQNGKVSARTKNRSSEIRICIRHLEMKRMIPRMNASHAMDGRNAILMLPGTLNTIADEFPKKTESPSDDPNVALLFFFLS